MTHFLAKEIKAQKDEEPANTGSAAGRAGLGTRVCLTPVLFFCVLLLSMMF